MSKPHKVSHVHDEERAAFHALLFWIHGIVLTLTGIVLIENVLWGRDGSFTSLTKNFELPFFIFAATFGLSLLLLAKWKRPFFTRAFPLYNDILSLVLVASIVISAFWRDPLGLLTILALNVVALAALILEWMGASKRTAPAIVTRSEKTIRLSLLLIAVFILLTSSGNTVSLLSPWTFALLAGCFVLLHVRLKVRWIERLSLPLALFFLTFVIFGARPDVNTHHYSFYLGPVIQTLYGGWHPLLTNAQYGGGVTAFLSAYFWLIGTISDGGLHLLIQILTFVQYSLIFLIAATLYRSRLIALLTLLAILMVSYFSQHGEYLEYPSIGFLRFGFIYCMLGLEILARHLPILKRPLPLLQGLLLGLAAIWSFESFLFTVPAFVAGEIAAGKVRILFKATLPIFLTVLALSIASLLLVAQPSALSQYFEYALLYAGAPWWHISPPSGTSLWWFFPPLYLWMLATLIPKRPEKIVIVLAIYGLAIFTYFVGRAHPNNLHHVAIPFILLLVYAILYRQGWPRTVVNGLTAAALALLLSTNYSHVGSGMILKDLWEHPPFSLRNFTHVLRQATGEREWCPEMRSALTPYVQGNSLALVSSLDETYALYSCLRVANAFNLNPYWATEMNPRATDRLMHAVPGVENRYILVDVRDRGKALTETLLEKAGAVFQKRIAAGGAEFLVYSR